MAIFCITAIALISGAIIAATCEQWTDTGYPSAFGSTQSTKALFKLMHLPYGTEQMYNALHMITAVVFGAHRTTTDKPVTTTVVTARTYNLLFAHQRTSHQCHPDVPGKRYFLHLKQGGA